MATTRWTPAEGWLMAEVARRSLAAQLEGGELVAISDAEDAPVRAFAQEIAGAIVLVLSVSVERATVTLVAAEPAGHRWRTGWMLEIERLGTVERQVLSPESPAIAATRGTYHAHLRLQRRAIVRELDGEPVQVPIADVACYRYTRQSTIVDDTPQAIVPGALEPWAIPTRPERRPWWEIDLGKAHYIAWLRIDFAALPAGTRVVVHAYGFLMPDGTPAPESEISSTRADGTSVTVAGSFVARYVRIELIGEVDVALHVTAAEVLAGDLFDDALDSTMRRAFALFHDRPLVLDRDGAALQTYGEVWARAMALARGLANRLEPRDGRITLVIMLPNRIEWVLADLAALARGYVIVPASPDDPDDRLAQMWRLARPTAVVCEREHVERVRAIAPEAFVIDLAGIDALCRAALGASVPPAVPRAPDELHSVLFTSGSTGMPKGAMRTYAGFFAMVQAHQVGHSPRHLSFQPLSHLSERMYLPSVLIYGGALAFSRGGAYLLEDLRALGPTTIGTVPRLFEVLYATYQRRLRGLLAATPDAPRGELERVALAEARASFGPRVSAISVGSAPVSAEVLAFLKRCFADLWVSEGYGSTEVGTIATDGKVPDDVHVKLVPGPDRGEIFVRSPHMIDGYLGDEAATKAAFDADGFFATGDLGERDGDGRVRVIGRVRNTVKLAQGEFVSAERIETALATAPVVDRIYVHAEHGAAGVAAVVVPRAEVLGAALGVEPGGELAELVAHPGAPAAVMAILRRHGASLAAYELPRAVVLEAEPFSVETGLLTGSGKLARPQLAKRYAPRIAEQAAPVIADAAPDELDEDVRRRVLRIASASLGRPVHGGEALAGSGVDSLAAAELLAALSDELGREVPLAWWFESRTFDELAAQLARFATADSRLVDLATAELRGEYAVTQREPAPPRRVLLTGATGFLGAHLVEALHARGIEPVCLVRAPDDAAAQARLDAALAATGCEVTARAFAGDLADLTAALPDTDAILHAGATVSWLASYAALVGPNVHGTRRLLEHACARGIPFHHVSTISTAPRGGDETSRLTLEAAAAGTPYALTKWIAEEHVRRAGEAGLRVSITRPAMIAGHSRRGTGNPEDFVNRYLVGCGELGVYIDRDDAILDMTPVDFVAGAIAALVAGDREGVFHLANVEQSLAFGALGRALAAAGVRTTPASYSEFRAALARTKTSRLHALAAFFPETFSLGMGPFPCDRTLAILDELGVVRPRIDDAIVARYVASLERRGHLRSAC